MQKTHRIDQRFALRLEGFYKQLDGRFCRECPIRVAPHAVGDDKQYRIRIARDGGTILVVIAAPNEADLSVFDAQSPFCLMSG
jgi:hypothetical protein